jgi:uncharacterized protein (UPF0276 family)
VPKAVWDLLGYVLGKSRPEVLIIEWDQNMPTTDRLIEEARYGEDFIRNLRRPKLTHRRVHNTIPAEVTL